MMRILVRISLAFLTACVAGSVYAWPCPDKRDEGGTPPLAYFVLRPNEATYSVDEGGVGETDFLGNWTSSKTLVAITFEVRAMRVLGSGIHWFSDKNFHTDWPGTSFGPVELHLKRVFDQGFEFVVIRARGVTWQGEIIYSNDVFFDGPSGIPKGK